MGYDKGSKHLMCIGDLIEKVDTRNTDGSVTKLLGISIDKCFISSVANVIGTDLTTYKVIHKNEFAVSLMQVSRDGKLPVSCLKDFNVAIMSPAYSIFKVVDSDVVLPDYLDIWVKRPEFDREATFIAIGGVRGSLPWEDFCRMKLPVPSIEEQRKIVRVNNLIVNRIDILNRINENLEKLVSILYRQMFEVFPLKKWRHGTISDIAKVASGKRPPMRSSTVTDEAIFPLVGASSIMGYTNATNHNDKILVIGRVGTHGIVQRFNSPCWASDNTLVITSDYYEYIYQILKKIDYGSLNRGSTQPLITQGDINKIPILIPDKDTLSKYEKIAGTIMSKYETNLQENQSLAQIRDTILPRLLSGKIDVFDIDI